MSFEVRSGRGAKPEAGASADETIDESDRSTDFETLLADISSRFVRAPLGEMDAAIHDVLEAVSSFTGVERSHVHEFDEDRGAMNEVVRWPRQECTDVARHIPRKSLAFYDEKLFSQQAVAISDPEEIPASAQADRNFLVELGVRSALSMPLIAAGETIGAMTVTTLTHRRDWTDAEIAMLHVVADIVAPALTRRRSEREQQKAINFERLITSLLSEFMNLPADKLDVGIDRALEVIARFVDCDRSATFVLDESGDLGILDHGWWSPGTRPVVDNYDRVEAAAGSLYGDWIRSTAPYLVLNAPTIEKLRPDAAEAICENRLGTVANFPLVIGGRRIGWFGVGASTPRVSWSAAELRSLGVAANALANMYVRRQSERDRRRHQNFEEALSGLAADFIKRPIAEIRTGIQEIVDRFGRFAASDRAAVLLIDQADGTASTYHEWLGRGDPAPVRNFPVSAAPAFFEQLMAATGPWYMYVEDFPESDALAASALDAIGIRTLLNCPIADGDQVYGYASIGYPKSRHRAIEGTEQVLSFASSIIANALSRERLEVQALEHREALSRALRLGSLGQLATGIAHELNQPLTAIVNYSRAGIRWLAAGDFDRGELAKILERVSEEAIRAGDIIHNLRNHVKGGPRERRASSVREIVEKACSLLAGTARDNDIAIVTEYEGSLPFVHAEATEIEQVVINVVQNAIDSIVDSGAGSGEVVIVARRDRAFVEVEITDTGPGFSDRNTQKLFDQFYTTKAGGLGLGLSISRALIESNGGTMRAGSASRKSHGSSIRFDLPVAGTRRSRGAKKSAAPSRPRA